MADSVTTIAQLRQQVEDFIAEREWNQFHSPKNLAMNLACEVAELMEHFLWVETHKADQLFADNPQEIEHEIADIAFGLFALCNRLGIDLSDCMKRKIALQAEKYPVELAKGNSAKYTSFKK